MKTITEIGSFYLAPIAKTLEELTAQGKSPEEIQAALMEAHKIPEERFKHLLNAAGIASAPQTGRPKRVKRILVMQAAEGEKAPEHSQKIDEFYYVAEYFPEATQAAHPNDRGRDRKDRGGKRGGRDGKRGESGRGGRGGERDNRPRGGDRAAGPRTQTDPAKPYVKPVVKPVTTQSTTPAAGESKS